MESDRVPDAMLLELSRMAASAVRGWVVENRPEDSNSRTFWWENLIYRALYAMYHSKSEGPRRQWAMLAEEAIQAAVRDGHTSPVRGAVRIADLTTEYLLRRGECAEVLPVDEVLGRNLGLVAISPAVAADRARRSQELTFTELIELRDAEDLIRSCAGLADRVEDAELAERLAQWFEAWPELEVRKGVAVGQGEPEVPWKENLVEATYRQEHVERPRLLRSSEDVDGMIDEMLAEGHELAFLYSQRRLFLSDGVIDHQVVVGVKERLGLGLMRFSDDEGTWVTVQSPAEAGAATSESVDGYVSYSALGHASAFLDNSEVPVDSIRGAVEEFLLTGGRRPTCVRWQVDR